MRFYKIIQNGFLECVGQGLDGEEITEQEYNDLLAIIRNKPADPEGYIYRINEANEYVLVEAPPAPPEAPLSADELVEILLGGEDE